jgi:hypothetical protein
MRLRILLSHDAEIVLGMLVEVFSLDDLTAPRGIPRHGGVALVVVTRILHGVAWVPWRTDARWSLVGRARTPLRS